MHFTGMLAYGLPITVSHEPLLTGASIIPALLGGGGTLYVLSMNLPKFWRLQLGAMVLSFSVVLMHYSGMEALVLTGTELAYDPGNFALSIIVIYLLACVALFVRYYD